MNPSSTSSLAGLDPALRRALQAKANRGRDWARAHRDQLERAISRDLAGFVRLAWPILEPGTPYVHGRVIDAVCQHLEAVTAGEIKRLLITVPPGTAKSLLTSVFWPAWEWGPKGLPNHRFLSFSYSDRLSVRDSRRTKLVVQGDWFQGLWPLNIADDQNAKSKFENDKRGWRMASSIGGVGTGERADRLVCLPPTAMLETELGFASIGDVVGRRSSVRVRGFDHVKGEPAWCDIEAWEQTGPRDLVEILTSGGRRLVCTADHPVFLSRKGYRPAAGAVRGDRVFGVRYVDQVSAERGAPDAVLLNGVQDREGQAREQPPVSELRSRGLSAPGASSTTEGRPVLQPGVQLRVEARREQYGLSGWDEEGDLRALRDYLHCSPGTDGTPPLLLARLLGEGGLGRAGAQGQRPDLPRVWTDLPAEPSGKDVLLENLQGRGARKGDERPRESSLRPRRVALPVQGRVHAQPEGGGAGERRPSLHDVRDHERPDGQGDGRPPYRLRQGERRPLQPDLSLQELPRQDARYRRAAPRVEEDTIVAVNHLGCADGSVFNVRVSPHHNYFADGLLVHNCDDPHAVADADSQVKLESTLLWFRETLPTRLNNPSESAIVVIMQRINQGDVAGEIISRELGYEHLCLPMRYEPERHCTTLGGRFTDWRTRPGQLLFPARYPLDVVEKLERVMGSYATSGQFQQNPSPRGGGLIQVDALRVVKDWPRDARVVRSWDLAATAEGTADDPDYTAGAKVAYKDGRAWIVDVSRDRLAPLAVEQRLAATAIRDGHGCAILVEREGGSSGKMTAEHLITRVLAGYEAREQLPTGSKIARSRTFAAAVEAGNVDLVEGPWNDAFVGELREFPRGRHDDQVDAAAAAFNFLASEPEFFVL